MKTEPKTFASLSSGLLARKGAARPAMRPQGFGGQSAGAGLEDLGWDDMGFEPPRAALSPVRDAEHDAFGDELSEPPLRSPLAGLTPVGSPVHGQQAELADRLEADGGADALSDEGEPDEDFLDDTAELYQPETDAEFVAAAPVAAVVVAHPAAVPAPRRAARPRAAPGSKAKAAFTLRLDTARHLKLRLACAVNASSAQILVTEALDAYLAGMPELDAMAAKANRKG
ncbi:hypothetical protein [Sphingomonas sp.]|uniref:hypothetical protein n=1 Tax=Sphingomonas sp. TaxID=28214 RepID=UPI00286D7D60|nr:hypothetical protein [Sphingomonas sp.]